MNKKQEHLLLKGVNEIYKITEQTYKAVTP